MIEIGIEDADAGRVIPREVVVEEMRRKWQLGEA
jgi:predicted transcriptional regulator